MRIDLLKLKSEATLLRNCRSTIQVTPGTEWLAEYMWSSFSELAYGPTQEAAEHRSLQRLHANIQLVASRIESIAERGAE